jgi:nicotinate-nucleotide pyrophosphorylase
MSDPSRLTAPARVVYEPLVRAALREDLGAAGDVTSTAIVGPNVRAGGRACSRGSCPR